MTDSEVENQIIQEDGNLSIDENEYNSDDSGHGNSFGGGGHSILGSEKVKLKRNLGLGHGFALMVGLILGSGIFVSPGLIARDTTSSGMLLIIWVVAGFVALMGSLSYCELASLTKMAGGNYANILYVYGNIPAFLCVWTTSLVIDPASISAIGIAVGTYLTQPFYDTEEDAMIAIKLVAFGAILIAAIVNCISVTLTNKVQRLFSLAQVSAVLFVVAIGIWQLSKGRTENFHSMLNGTHFEISSTLHIGVALFGGLWSYDGWAAVTNVLEEIKNVERNLILTVVTAFPFVMVCYILVNVSFLTLLTHKSMAASNAVGVDFVGKALGKTGSYVMMILVGLAGYGTLNGTILTCPRLTLAAAREGHMPTIFSLIHRKSASPIPAILLTTTMSLLLLIPNSNNLNSLILLFSQAQWVMYGSSIFGVVILRFTRPNAHRPFKIFILVPIIASLVALFLVIIPFFRTPMSSLFLFIFILCGLPVYVVLIHYNSRLPSCFSRATEFTVHKLQTYCNLRPCSKQDI